MNIMTDQLDDKAATQRSTPGAELANARLEKGLSQEYVAGKLHLRVKLIELLESDAYHLMPEPVFIKGYLRAYAKLLNLPADPLITQFQSIYKPENKLERTLWQSRKQINGAEKAIRWLTGIFALIVLTAVIVWWYANKEDEQLFSNHLAQHHTSVNKSENEIRLTDLSKMRSLLSSQNPNTTVKDGS